MLYLAAAFDFDAARFTLPRRPTATTTSRSPAACPACAATRSARWSPRAIPADRARGAILAFDNLDALRAASRSPVGTELRADEERLIRQARVVLIDGEEIV